MMMFCCSKELAESNKIRYKKCPFSDVSVPNTAERSSEQRSSHRGTLLRSLLRIVLGSAVFQHFSQSVRRKSQTGNVHHPLSTSKLRPQPALQLKTVRALTSLGNRLAVRPRTCLELPQKLRLLSVLPVYSKQRS